MAKTRRSHYLDDETLAFIEDLCSKGLAQNKSQAVRRGLKTAIDRLNAAPDELAPDRQRRYEDIDEGKARGDDRGEQGTDGGDDRGTVDEGGGSSPRRSVPSRGSNDRANDHEPSDEDPTPNDAGAGKNGRNTLRNLNPFN